MRKSKVKERIKLFNVDSESLERLRHAVTDGRTNPITKRNKTLSTAEKEIAKFDKELSSAVSEVMFYHRYP